MISQIFLTTLCIEAASVLRKICEIRAQPIKSVVMYATGHYTATKVAYLHGLYPLRRDPRNLRESDSSARLCETDRL